MTTSEQPRTTSPGDAHRLYVWAWLPGSTEPVVAGALDQGSHRLRGEPVLTFTYAASYRARPQAISLFEPEVPLRAGQFDPSQSIGGREPLALHGCLRDSAPDAWGRRVLNSRLAGSAEHWLSELTYLSASSSDRIGALDFQHSPTEYVARSEPATLEQLLEAADLIDRGETLPNDLAAAALHGTSIGGARPKAVLDDGGRKLIAKFSSASDARPVVKAEAVAMILARHVGLDVAPVEVVRSLGRDVLLVERFDRTADGGRRLLMSALTLLGYSEMTARYASYPELADLVRTGPWANVGRTLRELYRRLVFNICVGNSDDHLRNHAALWDGTALELSPAYDLCPQPRHTSGSSQAIGVTRDRQNASQLRLALAAAPDFLVERTEAADVIDAMVDTIRSSWQDAADEAQLSRIERDLLWGREILNEYVFWDTA